MEKKLVKLLLYKLTTPNLNDFVQKYNTKNDTTNESEVQRNHNFPFIS